MSLPVIRGPPAGARAWVSCVRAHSRLDAALTPAHWAVGGVAQLSLP